MDFRSLFRNRLLQLSVAATALVTVIFGALAPQAAWAIGAEPPPVYPCPFPKTPVGVVAGLNQGYVVGASPGATFGLEFGQVNGLTFQYECEYYEYFKELSKALQRTVMFGVVTALLDSMTVLSQAIAEQTANWVYSGFDETPQFFTKEYDAFLRDIVTDVYNRQLSELNESFFKKELGWDLCQPLSLNLKVALGVGRMARVPPPNCTFETVKAAFSQTKDSLSKEQIALNLKQSVSFGGNDINIAISANQKILQELVDTKQERILDRQEGQGFKNFKGLINGQIRQPSQVARDTVSEANLLKQINEGAQLNTSILAQEAFVAGLEQMPYILAGSFVNTIALRAVSDLQNWLQGTGSDPDAIPIDLTLDGADPNAESGTANTTQEKRKNIISQFFSDIFRPNLNSGEQQDFVVLMTTCPTPRGLWGCSMDNGMAGALRAAVSDGGMTVGKAAGLIGGATTQYLHPDWELIPEWEAKDSQDPGCYQRAYCATNLAKLRFARILPVGWELAANSVYNKKNQGKYITLGQVMAGFNDCNAQGTIDDQHPWCKLINPAWVLTAPPFKCSVQGYTDAVFGAGDKSSIGAVRIQECVDVVSCLTRDDSGNCVGGYGYCAAEKTVWRFGGDQCDEKFSSCRSFKKPSKQLGAEPGSQTATNEIVSYVRNTIDYGACTADNSGCLYYLTLRDVTTSTADVWRGSIASNWKIVDSDWKTAGTAHASRIYFDKTVKPCDASNDGCTKLLTMQPQTSSLNLLQNGSFEQTDDVNSTKLQAWQNEGAVPYVFKGFQNVSGDPEAFAGTVAADFQTNNPFGEISQVVAAAGGRYYTMSVYGKNRVPGQNGAIEIQAGFLIPYTGVGPSRIGPDGRKYTLLGALPQGLTYGSDCQNFSGNLVTSQSGLSDAWGRETCTFALPKEVTGLLITVKGKIAAIDAAQLEESQTVTEFVDGVNSSLAVQHLKVAPEELACTGVKATDRAECGNYARVCSQIDAGCQAYQELGGDGAEIPANLSRSDYCPESCVGYAEYRKQPSAFDLTKNTDIAQLNDADDDTTAHFIPTNALQCTADAAGCEEFTSVENQAAGGESKAYFRYVRACELPGQNTKTFFTWEGSDQTGYQLRTWSLIANGNQPKLLAKAGPDGILKDAANCTEDLWKSGSDLDCRQFYNEGGTVFYAYYSQTVLSTNTCTDYRVAFSNIDDCTKTGGNWNATAKQCTYSVNVPESASCPQQYAGCRGYVGTTGKNSQTVISDTFSGAKSVAGFVAGKGVYGSGSNVSFSQEALLVGDNSLKVTHPVDGKGGVEVTFSSTKGSLYMVSFWAKSTKQNPADSFTAIQDAANNKSSFKLNAEWKRYELGPFAANKTDEKNVAFIYNLPNETYLDEVKIKQLRDVSYVVKDTWVIPDECDRTPEGIAQPQAMLGCRAYQDRNSKKVNVRQFNNLCKYENVGCTGYVDTRNSDSPYVQQFEMKGLPEVANPARKLDNLYSGTVTTIRPADRNIYLIDEPASRCDASQASCRAFGKPSFDPKWKQTGTQTVYLIDDITKYVNDGEPQAMCRPSELFCDTFVSNSVVSYFRDPQEHACTWKDKIALPAASAPDNAATGLPGYSYPAGEYSGWFMQSGTTTLPCYPHLLSNANTFLIDSPFANTYQGWTANCPKDQSECTEFRDSNDHTDPVKPIGKPYYFIDNGRVDKSTCGDVADPFNGCVLIRDMNDATLRFNAKATYAESHAKGDTPVTPLDCAGSDKSNPHCVGVGVCVEPKCSGDGSDCAQYGGDASADVLYTSCTVDADCTYTGSQGQQYSITARCELNDSNRVVKVKLDRDCKAWFGCRSGETVYDDAQQKYVDLCTEYSLCDRAGGSSQGNFCSNYINRTLKQPLPTKPVSPYFERVLREGVFMNDRSYSLRQTEFVDPDYAGYTIANRFQMADLVSRRVGYDILRKENPKKANEYFDDYRLVSAVPLAITAQEKTAANASIYGQLGWAEDIQDATRPNLNLCQHKFTKQIGYYVPGEEPKRCYLAIDTPLTQVVTDVQGAAGNSRNAQTIATVFAQDPKASRSIYMNQVMPGVECKAYPDSQSPFGNEFVTEWDTTVQPNKPKTYAAGFENVATCERGEDCSCQYAKVNYAGGLTKYIGILSKNAPPQGVCVGGDKDGQACIPDSKTKSVDYSDPSAVIGTSVNEACGTGSTCQPLQGTTYVRGASGFCIQRDAAVTVGDKGRYQCLTWNPQPVLAGSKDVYHYSPTAGYNPPLNSGEYYCVSPVTQAKEGIALSSAKDAFAAPGQSTQFTYDERCASSAYDFEAERMQGVYTVHAWNKVSDDYDDMADQHQQTTIADPNNKLKDSVPACKNIDGTNLRETQMAKWCGMGTPKIEWFKGEYERGQQIGDGDILASISNYSSNISKDYIDSVDALFQMPQSKKAFLYQPFVNLWNSFTSLISAASCLGEAIGNLVDSVVDVGLGGDSCKPQVKVLNGFWTKRIFDRASFAAPSATLSNPLSFTHDENSLRLITTGEGKDKSYAEYFVPASSPYVQKILDESGVAPAAGDNLLESQIGYFKLNVPQPGNENTAYSDEKNWTASISPGSISTSKYDREHILTQPAKGKRPDYGADDWGFFWAQTAGMSSDLGNFGPDKGKIDWYYNAPPDTQNPVKSGQPYGQLGCLFSPEWVDGVSVSDWADEKTVKAASDQWHKGFNKFFQGYVSRAKQGFLKTQDGSQLLQLPCKNNAAQNCYYKYWETGYKDDGESKFNIFNTTDGALGPVQMSADKTYFRRANGSKHFFSVRAMFENMNAEDNAKSPLEQANDGSQLKGPFKFVGFWVTASAPGTASSRAIYMRISTALANSCRDVAQVISPKDRKNAAFTDRVWEQSSFLVPQLNFMYGTENAPFGSALHQRMIGHDPMMMIDTAKGVVSPDANFVKAGQQFDTRSRTNKAKSDKSHVYTYFTLSNLFARVYQVYQFYDVPVKKGESMCFFGPYAGRRCTAAADCSPDGDCFTSSETQKTCTTVNGVESCTSTTIKTSACKGGVFNGQECKVKEDCELKGDWYSFVSPAYDSLLAQSCKPVGGSSAETAANPAPISVSIAGFGTGKLGIDCRGEGDPNSTDPDLDANRCTHGVGYYPRPDICITNKENVECLTGIKLSGGVDAYSLSMARAFPSPTDVTQGWNAMDITNGISVVNGVPKNPGDNSFKFSHVNGVPKNPGDNSFKFSQQDFISSYVPRPPRIAAPDTSRQCTSPGQCAIAKMDALNIDNASEGKVIYYGSQANVTMRFYAWSADNQAPISDVWIDWGDGSVQKVSDARVKNKKPFCGVSKQCEFAPGLTCNSDSDCPPAAGKCYGTGFCSNNSGRSCRVGLAGGSDCDAGGTCVERLTYGSSPLACEANYFEFKHSYNCSALLQPASSCAISQNNDPSKDVVKSCTVPKAQASAKTECRFVPRVFIQDNWGWCTGDCKQSMTGALALKNPAQSPKDVSFKNGGCYDGSVARAQFSTDDTAASKVGPNMCDAEDAAKKRYAGSSFTYDPWLRFSGYVELRSNE